MKYRLEAYATLGSVPFMRVFDWQKDAGTSASFFFAMHAFLIVLVLVVVLRPRFFGTSRAPRGSVTGRE
jgi:hypothetical protein